jgi:hypothetical protein
LMVATALILKNLPLLRTRAASVVRIWARHQPQLPSTNASTTTPVLQFRGALHRMEMQWTSTMPLL